MTRQDAINRKRELELKRMALIDQIADLDVASASVSAGGGSRSYTNRSIEELKRKVKVIDGEVARLDYLLNGGVRPGTIVSIYPRYK